MKNFKFFLIAVLTMALFTQTNSFAQNLLGFSSAKLLPNGGHTGTMSMGNEIKTNLKVNNLMTLNCPTPVWTPKKTVACNSPYFQIDVKDSAAIGGFMAPGFKLVVTGMNSTQCNENRIEAWHNSKIQAALGYNGVGAACGTGCSYYGNWSVIPPGYNCTAAVFYWTWQYFGPNDTIDFHFYDTGNNGTYNWQIIDLASGKVAKSGTWTFPIGASPGYVSTGKISKKDGINNGTATYTCPTCPVNSLYQFQQGSAVFDPTAPGVKAGKYPITYTFTYGSCSKSYTDTITVTTNSNSAWTPTGTFCAGQTYDLTGFATVGGGNWAGGSTSSSGSFTPLSASTYTVSYTVGGTGNCSSITTKTITVIAQPTVTATASPSSICASGSTNVTLSAGGATNYTWAGGLGSTSSITVSPSSTTTYTVTGSNAGGCSNTQTVTVSINPQPTVTRSSVSILCNGKSTGSITTTPATGSTPYTFNWSNGSTTQNLSTISAGTYAVTITDNKGCTVTTSATLTEPSSALTVPTPTSSNTGCGTPTGSVSVSPASGGTPVYSYSWTGGKTGQSVTGLGAGTYSLTVTDANGCTAVTSTTVSSTTAGPAVDTISTKSVVCNGKATGNIFLNVGGSVTYAWSNGGTTDNISGLTAGTYTVTVTNTVNSCPTVKSYTIKGPPAYNMGTNIETHLKCKGDKSGKLEITPTGNNPAYNYEWLPGSLTIEDITGLAAGTYTLNISDTKGCAGSFTYTLTEPTAVTATATQATQAGCGLSDGSATASGSGGTGSKTYSWSNGSTNSTATGLSAGSYIVTVTDGNGCTGTASVSVTNPNPPTASISNSTNASCGQSDGTATVLAGGGTPGYSYTWNNGQTTTTASGLGAGTVTVTVTDNKGCSAVTSTTITSLGAPTVTVTSTNASCGANDGTASASANGGTPGYSYSWSPGGAITANVSNLAGGTYTVVVTDTKGCSVSGVTTISSSSNPNADFTASKYIGDSPLVVDFTNTSTGGTTYTWYFGDGSAPYTGTTPPTHTYSVDGKYYACVVASAGAGCKDSTCKDITVSGFKIAVPNIITPNGDKKNDVFVITTKGVTKLDITIWDRWGLQMWEGTGLTPDAVTGFFNTWEGKTTSGKE
ncbi:MAG: gliding motility-associated C-terminal domain-containing protein, partial [Bacteroidia bacterium]|nr:gliding motility-associated C-terminal domain-containing protein [Bacteroidia bacterium]